LALRLLIGYDYLPLFAPVAFFNFSSDYSSASLLEALSDIS